MNYTKCFCDPTKDLNPRVLQISDYQPMLRYIIMMYDPNSPLRKNYPELDLRKRVASQESGYDLQLQDGEKSELEREPLTLAIVTYLRMVNNRIWTQICSVEEAIWEYNRRILEPIKANAEDKDKDELSAVNMKSKMIQDLDLFEKRLQELERLFYVEDEITEVIKKKRFRPENISEVNV